MEGRHSTVARRLARATSDRGRADADRTRLRAGEAASAGSAEGRIPRERRAAPQSAVLLAVSGLELPDARLLGRHARAHERRRWMPARSAVASGSKRPTASHAARKSPRRWASGCGSPGRSTSSRSPTTPTTWDSSRTCSPASRTCSRIRPASKWYDMINSGEGVKAALDIIDNFSRGTFPKEIFYAPGMPEYRSAWENVLTNAEKYNDPGKFTAFIGYEWTSQVPPGNNLHRVVHLPRRRRQGGPDGAVHHLSAARAARRPKTSGRRSAPTRTRPAGGCWRSRTTATSRTA